jgi:hypothetical protein
MKEDKIKDIGVTRIRQPSSTEHPVALGSFVSWLKLLSNGKGVDRAYIPRALFVCFTTLLTSPLRLWESIRYGRRIHNTSIHPSPIFIIGHWRGGTTHLQNLLFQDKNLGCLTTFQAMAPGFCLIGDGAIKRLIAKQANACYPTRLIDNVPLDFDAQQEDEFALASLSPAFFCVHFPFHDKQNTSLNGMSYSMAFPNRHLLSGPVHICGCYAKPR